MLDGNNIERSLVIVQHDAEIQHYVRTISLLKTQGTLFKLIYNISQFHDTVLQSVATILSETNDR
jgi:hypothetical protein